MKAGGHRSSLPDFIRILAKRKWILFACLAGSMVVAAVVSRRRPPLYRTHSSVEIEQYYTLSPTGRGYSHTDATTEANIITSLPVAFGVARRLGRIPPEMSPEQAMGDERLHESIKRLQAEIRPRPRHGTMILDIEVTSGDPREACEIADMVAETYVQYRNRRTKERTDQARFLTVDRQQQIEKMLEEAERELNEYRLSHRLVAPETSMTVHLGRLMELEDRQQELSDQERATREALAAVRVHDANSGDVLNLPALPFSSSSAGYEAAKQEYLSLMTESEELAASLNSLHPSLQSLKIRMDMARARLEDALRRILEQTIRRGDETAHQTRTLEAQKADFTAEQIELVRLERKVDRHQAMLDQMQGAWQATEFEAGYKGEIIRIIEKASLPTEPVGGKEAGTIAGVLVLGLALGIGLALVRETFDFSVDNIVELEGLTGLPVLSMIPFFTSRKIVSPNGNGKPPSGGIARRESFEEKMVLHFWPKHPASEAFRLLRTHLRKRGGNGHRVFLVTSASPQEGKSFTSSNLAIACAQANYRVLLIEANMRRPGFHKVFPFRRGKGLSSVIADNAPWRGQVRGIDQMILDGLDLSSAQASPGLANLHVLPAGPTMSHPAEGLENLLERDFLEEVKSEFEIVIVDCPPVLPVADSVILAPAVDGVLLVYRSGRTPRDMLLRAVENLRGVGASLVGLVLNGVEFRGLQSNHRYLYRYPYHRDPKTQDGQSLRV